MNVGRFIMLTLACKKGIAYLYSMNVIGFGENVNDKSWKN